MSFVRKIVRFDSQLEFVLDIDSEEDQLDNAESDCLQHPFANVLVSEMTSRKSDWDELNRYANWKEGNTGQFGCGSPAPCIPLSQRQYDGENSFEFCEQMLVR